MIRVQNFCFVCVTSLEWTLIKTVTIIIYKALMLYYGNKQIGQVYFYKNFFHDITLPGI